MGCVQHSIAGGVGVGGGAKIPWRRTALGACISCVGGLSAQHQHRLDPSFQPKALTLRSKLEMRLGLSSPAHGSVGCVPGAFSLRRVEVDCMTQCTLAVALFRLPEGAFLHCRLPVQQQQQQQQQHKQLLSVVVGHRSSGPRTRGLGRTLRVQAAAPAQEQEASASRLQAPTDIEYDAVIIGSGMGGLTTAAKMAAKGAKVVVLEK
jgi:hypothetical protein